MISAALCAYAMGVVFARGLVSTGCGMRLDMQPNDTMRSADQ